MIAIWAIATGLFEVTAAIRLRREIENEWALILGGLLSILLGLLLVAFPPTGLVTLVYLVALYALLFGILLIALAFRLRPLATR